MVYCTLFDSNYLDKGLVMYDSLVNSSCKFILYILCMDDKCYDVLTDLSLKNVRLIKLEEIEDDELLIAKSKRTRGEYCWTCSSSLILYILLTYKERICTYIDADMYFYQDPKILIDEMNKQGASVQIISHRFHPLQKDLETIVGKYCVEFDTFLNDKKGIDVLVNWRKQCLQDCSAKRNGKLWGDQKYQDDWMNLYDCVCEVQHLGGGVAPWNVGNYRWVRKNGNLITLIDKFSKKEFNIVFFHYENIQYISRYKVNINVFSKYRFVQRKLIKELYLPYLYEIDKKKQMLAKYYGIDSLIKKHPAFRDKIDWKIGLEKYIWPINISKILSKMISFLCVLIVKRRDIIKLT